jgi:hypothetical protein
MRGGKRAHAGRKRLPRAEPITGIEKFRWIIAELQKNKSKAELAKECPELKHWRALVNDKNPRIRLDTWRFLYDHAYGKATQPVDHGAGGPVKVEMNVNVNMPDPHE